eukprot:971297_1
MQPSVSPITVEPSVSQSTAAPTTHRPTASPITGHPSEPTEPTASPSTKSIIGTNHTISIVFHSCVSVHSCDINKTTITNQIDAIIVAYIDYNTQILSTEIMNNEVVIILAIGMDEYNSLLGQRISDRIES